MSRELNASYSSRKRYSSIGPPCRESEVSVETGSRAANAVAEYIEIFYNRQRLHSYLGDRTPAEALADHHGQAVA
jgi:transposase InsO family protein